MKLPQFTAKFSLLQSHKCYREKKIFSQVDASDVRPSVMCRRVTICPVVGNCWDCIFCGPGKYMCVRSENYM